MKRVLVITALLLLAACQGQQGSDSGLLQPDQGPVIVMPPEEPQIILPPVRIPNWSASLEIAVEKMVPQTPWQGLGGILLVNDINNNSDSDQDTRSLTERLKQMIALTQHFTLITDASLTEAKQALGLQDEDSLNTRSKAIGLARYLSAPYILYTSIEGKELNLTLSSQIMQVQTGELIWTEKTPVLIEE